MGCPPPYRDPGLPPRQPPLCTPLSCVLTAAVAAVGVPGLPGTVPDFSTLSRLIFQDRLNVLVFLFVHSHHYKIERYKEKSQGEKVFFFFLNETPMETANVLNGWKVQLVL